MTRKQKTECKNGSLSNARNTSLTVIDSGGNDLANDSLTCVTHNMIHLHDSWKKIIKPQTCKRRNYKSGCFSNTTTGSEGL